MELQRKLFILADAAKYDASCASSGSQGRDSLDGKGMGSVTGMGICHSYAPDGRCISLLKILLTNVCIFDCRYCINRKSSNVQRARFTVAEVVQLTLDFYRRNCIEGLFLSSGIIRSSDYTMEQLVEVARRLREEHDFRGYIHLKTIPDAAPELLAQAGRHADRLSINVELPTASGLAQFAPEKDGRRIRQAMQGVDRHVQAWRAATREQRQAQSLPGAPAQRAAVPRFAPGGQSTQMIVGADRATDADILESSHTLYAGYGLRRVYYSAFSPIPDARATCRRRHRPSCASTGSTRPTGSCAFTATGRARSRRPAATACWTWRSTPSWPGHWPTASSSPWTSTVLRAACCCACRAWARRRWSACWRRAACAGCGWTTCCGCAPPCKRPCPSC